MVTAVIEVHNCLSSCSNEEIEDSFVDAWFRCHVSRASSVTQQANRIKMNKRSSGGRDAEFSLPYLFALLVDIF